YTRSTVSSDTSASATQMQPNPTCCAGRNGSPNSSTASSSCKLGPRYCRKPSVDKGSRRAAAPKHSSSTAGTTPLARISRLSCQLCLRNADCSPTDHQARKASDGGVKSTVSTDSPTRESTGATLRISPYNANDIARTKASQGTSPRASTR